MSIGIINIVAIVAIALLSVKGIADSCVVDSCSLVEEPVRKILCFQLSISRDKILSIASTISNAVHKELSLIVLRGDYMSRKARFLSLLLSFVLVFSFIPAFSASAGILNLPDQSGSSLIHREPAQIHDGPVQGSRDIVPGELLVKFKTSTGLSLIERIHSTVGAIKINEIKGLNIHHVKLPKSIGISDAISAYEKMKDVEYAEPNHYRHILATPNDTYYSYQWSLPKIKAPLAWDVTTGDAVTVAVVDTGVDYGHEDLAGKVINGYDFINNDNNAMDDHWHGTHVAGTVATATNNSKGIAGVSWGAKILAVKVLDSNGGGTDLTVANGIKYAADNGAKVINLSLGGPGYSSTLADAVAYAQSKGCIIVAAAGNENTSEASYPAAYWNVIGVAATDSNDNRASFSNYGWYVDVAAPGVDIASCYAATGGYAYASGTSMATPHVAGLAALTLSRYPNRNSSQLIRTLQETVDDLGATGNDAYYGYGRINAENAIKTNFINNEENTADTAYSGTWSSGSSSAASGGAYRYSTSSGATATHTFYGTGIAWIAYKSTSSGIAKVYIDGTYQKDVDLYGTTDYQQIAYINSGLSLGTHTIRVVVSGKKNGYSSGYRVNVDAFDVIAPEATEPVPSEPAPSEPAPPQEADVTPPVGSISINNGAPYTYSYNVTLKISASDPSPGSGVSQMMISNYSSFSGASWIAYSTSKSWTLTSGRGTKRVYIKFKDGAGNISSTYSDSIYRR